jgi:hypothetical protein
MNVEEIVIAYLPDVVGEDWAVSGDMPDPRPESFILVDRTGGPRESMVLDKAEILIEVYHKTSRPAASNMAQHIADNITALQEHEAITRARVNSVVNLGDLIGGYQRYQVYCDIWGRR